MKNIISLIFFVLCIFVPAKSHAEQSILELQTESTNEVIPVSEGDRVPFDGMLFPINLAIEMGLQIESLRARLQLDVEREQRLCIARLELNSQILEVEKKRRDDNIQILQDTIDKQYEEISKGKPWYRSWSFGLIVGVISSFVIVGATTLLVLNL